MVLPDLILPIKSNHWRMKIRVFAGSPVEMIGLLDLFRTSPYADVYAFSAMQWGHILSSILRSSFMLNTILSLSFHVSGKGDC